MNVSPLDVEQTGDLGWIVKLPEVDREASSFRFRKN
jgi:hypothetical protein